MQYYICDLVNPLLIILCTNMRKEHLLSPILEIKNIFLFLKYNNFSNLRGMIKNIKDLNFNPDLHCKY